MAPMQDVNNLPTEKSHINLEFAHWYADEDFGEEQIVSSQICSDLYRLLASCGQTVSTSILVDDRAGCDDVREVLQKNSIICDYVGYESRYEDLAHKVVTALIVDKKCTAKTINHVDHVFLNDIKLFRNQKATCAVLSATWLLCRLGCLDHPEIDRFTQSQPFAEKAVIILPKRYRQLEQRVLDIIAATPFHEEVNNIFHVFF